jgi:histidinol-phosphate phosphatase family protein
MKNLLFLDRDGVIIEDREWGYLGDPYGIRFMEGVFEGLMRLKEKNFHFFVFTNQSGIGKGYYGFSDVLRVHKRIDEFFYSYKIYIKRYYFCPHLPNEGCSCRKPGISLYRIFRKEFPFEYQNKFMIGDKDSDIEFGKRLNFRTIFIKGKYKLNSNPDFIAEDFSSACDYICSLV